MFDYTHSNNYTTDAKEKQDTNEKILENLHLNSIAKLNSTPIWNSILQIFFLSTVEFTFSKWNLISQIGIHFFNSPFFNIV